MTVCTECDNARRAQAFRTWRKCCGGVGYKKDTQPVKAGAVTAQKPTLKLVHSRRKVA